MKTPFAHWQKASLLGRCPQTWDVGHGLQLAPLTPRIQACLCRARTTPTHSANLSQTLTVSESKRKHISRIMKLKSHQLSDSFIFNLWIYLRDFIKKQEHLNHCQNYTRKTPRMSATQMCKDGRVAKKHTCAPASWDSKQANLGIINMTDVIIIVCFLLIEEIRVEILSGN